MSSGMEIAAETVQPTRSQLVIHGLLTIDTLNGNDVIWCLATSAIGRTPNNTNGSASRHDVGEGTVVVEEMGNYKTGF